MVNLPFLKIVSSSDPSKVLRILTMQKEYKHTTGPNLEQKKTAADATYLCLLQKPFGTDSCHCLQALSESNGASRARVSCSFRHLNQKLVELCKSFTYKVKSYLSVSRRQKY